MDNQESNTFVYYDIVYKEWLPQAKTNSELALIEKYADKQKKILDIGVGSGRHLIPLHQQGYQIEGIDILDQAIYMVKSKDKTAAVELKNIFESNYPPTSFQLTYSMWNAFPQIVTTKEQAKRLLTIVNNLLEPGGYFIFDISANADPNDDWNFHFKVEHDQNKYTLNWSLLDYDKNTRTTRCEEHIQVKDRTGQIIDDVKAIITQRWWTTEEIKELSNQAGFSCDDTKIKDSDYLYYILKKESQ